MSKLGIKKKYLTFVIAKQWFAVPVEGVRDVLDKQRMNRIPLASEEVVGSINLLGRIVTVLDIRPRLGLPSEQDGRGMQVVVQHGDELYSLLVDRVDEVPEISEEEIGPVPATLDAGWRIHSTGVVRREKRLVSMLDIASLLDAMAEEAAA